MNRYEARKLADTITNVQLYQMLVNAKAGITNWEEASICNKGMSKGFHQQPNN